MKHSVPHRIKSSFCTFWYPGTVTLGAEQSCRLSKITKLRLNPVWQRMAAVGVKGLKLEIPREMIYRWHWQYSLCALCWNWFLKRTTSESTLLNRRASVKKVSDFSFFWFLFLCYGVEFVYFIYVAYRAVDILACDLISRFLCGGFKLVLISFSRLVYN